MGAGAADPTDGVNRSGPIGVGRPLAHDACTDVVDLVRRWAATTPEAVAVDGSKGSIDYRRLMAWSASLADRVRAAGAGPGATVAVLCAPRPAMVAAVLGILEAGAAYVPIDPSFPPARIDAVLADAGPRVAVVDRSGATRMAASGLTLIALDDRAPDAPPASTEAPAAVGEDAAYVIYSSGSTGEPKGVVVERRNLAASTAARRIEYPEAGTFLLVSPLAFDSSAAGLWGTLTGGGRLVVATEDEVRDPAALVALIEHFGVTRTLMIPGLYAQVLAAAARAGSTLDSLVDVIVAGTAVDDALVEEHFARTAGAALVNEYGPTEATVWASSHRFTKPEPVTIGRAVAGTRIHLLDGGGRLVAPGDEGEIHIAGAGVARGYLGRPEATAVAFVADPFGAEGDRMYRTGDRARWDADGRLVFLGRTDDQVKVRGHRVDLGAIDAALRAQPGVEAAAAAVDSAHTSIDGFVVGPGLAPAAIRTDLAERLPAAMVPARVHVVDALPLLYNGKVDRAGLAERARPAPAPPAPANLSGDDLTGAVAAAWGDVLDLRDVPAKVNFFDLGGHSLAMFELQDALEQRTGARPTVVSLFRHTTVTAQAAHIAAGPAAPDDTRRAAARRVAARRSTSRSRPRGGGTVRRTAPAAGAWLHRLAEVPDASARLICFGHAGASASFFRDWAGPLPGIEVHAVRYPGRAERIDEPTAVDLVALAGDIAAAVVPLCDRDVALFGHSMGAAVALETARRLETLGIEVAHVFASGARDGEPPAASETAEVDGDEDDEVRQLVELGGMDPELAADPDFRQLVMPYVRADGRMFHAYAMEPEPRLRGPVTCIVGDRDPHADRRRWRDLTSGGFREEVVTGDHFYLAGGPPSDLILTHLGRG